MGYDKAPIAPVGGSLTRSSSRANDEQAASRPGSMVVIVGAGVAVGLATAVWAQQGDAAARAAAAAGPELGRLLMFMAAVKAVVAIAALLLVGWRLRFNSGKRLAVGYVAGALAMAASPGLIWSLAYVAAGATLFHGGLLSLLALAWIDRGRDAAWRGLLPIARRTGPG